MKTLPSFRAWFERTRTELDALVLDVDGVLTVGGRPVAGSLETIRRLRELNFPFSLLTNDSNNSTSQKRELLRRLGFDFLENEIVSCGDGLVEVAAQRRLRGKRFFVVGELGRPNYAARAGMRVTRRLEAMDRCAGVIVGETNYAWEPVINAAVNFFLRHPDRLFICPNPDESYPSRRGVRIAAGGTARFIQHVLGSHGVPVSILYMGKPYRPIFEHNHAVLQRRLGRPLTAGRVLMLGDSLASDVRGATDFGYRAALILTGLTASWNLRISRLKPEVAFRGF